jgi:hypothetical protein
LTAGHPLPESLINSFTSQSYPKLLLYAKHGKSVRLQFWDFEALCKSNSNLVQVNPKLHPEQYVVPENGLCEGLCHKSLFMKPVGY